MGVWLRSPLKFLNLIVLWWSGVLRGPSIEAPWCRETPFSRKAIVLYHTVVFSTCANLPDAIMYVMFIFGILLYILFIFLLLFTHACIFACYLYAVYFGFLWDFLCWLFILGYFFLFYSFLYIFFLCMNSVLRAIYKRL